MIPATLPSAETCGWYVMHREGQSVAWFKGWDAAKRLADSLNVRGHGYTVAPARRADG